MSNKDEDVWEGRKEMAKKELILNVCDLLSPLLPCITKTNVKMIHRMDGHRKPPVHHFYQSIKDPSGCESYSSCRYHLVWITR